MASTSTVGQSLSSTMFLKTIKRLIGKFRLRTVLTISLVVLLVCAMGIIWVFSFLNSQYIVSDLAGQLENEISDRIVQHLDVYLETPQLVNKLCLDSIKFGGVDIHDNSALEKYFRALSYRFPTVESICYANEEDGNYTIISTIGSEGITNGTDRYLGFSRASTNYSFEEYLTDNEGRIIRQTVKPLPYDPRTRPWYKTAITSDKPSWTPIYMWVEGVVSQDAVIPVHSIDNRIIGVLDTSLTLIGISDFLQNLEISQNGEAFILEKSGLLIASSESNNTYSNENGTLIRLSALNSSDLIIQATTRYLINQAHLNGNITVQEQFKLDINNTREWIQVTPYQDQYGLDWLIVVAIPESDIMGKINHNNNLTFLLIVTVVICIIFLCIGLARWITRPILSLNRSARSLSRGNWTDWTDLDRHDEIGELSQSFKQMANQLRTTFVSLKSSEERYIRLFQSSADAILLFDNFTLVQMNKAGEEMFNIASKDAIGLDIRNLFADIGLGIGDMIRQGSESGKSYLDRTISRTNNSEEQYMNIRLTHIPDENRNLSLVHIRDISDQRKAIIAFAEQDALKESYNQINTILQLLPDPTFVINAEGQIIIWNRAIEKLTGKNWDEMIGKKNYAYSKALHNTEKPILIDIALSPKRYGLDLYPDIEQSGDLLKTSFDIDVSGERKFFSCLAGPLYNKVGEIIGAIESIRDITSHKLNEEALLIANKKLNLLSSITRHDILNKIMITKAHLFLLDDTNLTSEQIESTSAIKRSMIEIEHFVSFTKTYQELGLHVPIWQDVGETCNRVIKDINVGSIIILNNVFGISILADPLFEKVCYNIIENAIRHGENLSEISISGVEQNGKLTLIFEDNGIGISTENKEIIFERGFGKNTGYGLFLTREILSISDISIIESGQPGFGCRFEILVPKGKFRFNNK